MLKFCFIVIFLWFSFPLNTLSFGGTIDTVYSFNPGSGQNSGQSEEFFPMNIFGLPSQIASEFVPAAGPDEVLSIGMDGEIIVGFKDKVLYNGEGPDFTIFENVFRNPANGKLFVEPAIVSVSKDGLQYYEFPHNYETLVGCAGITPTFGDQDPFNPEVSGGDSFDLSTLGLDYIKYIKIKDFTHIISKDRDHFYFDFILSGFDLDAVVAIYLKEDVDKTSVAISESKSPNIVYSNDNKTLIINNIDDLSKVKLFDILGNCILEKDVYQPCQLDISNTTTGVYFLCLQSVNNFFNLKIFVE